MKASNRKQQAAIPAAPIPPAPAVPALTEEMKAILAANGLKAVPAHAAVKVLPTPEQLAKLETLKADEIAAITARKDYEVSLGISRRISAAGAAAKAAGQKQFFIAGRPTLAQVIKVYGPKGPTMSWEQRAKAGVPAEKFQAVLAEKSKQ